MTKISKITLGFLTIIIIIFSFYYTNKNSSVSDTNELTQQEVDQYVTTTLEASFVKYLRDTLNKYVADETSFMKSTAYAGEMIGDQKCGLKSFDISYYKSKFTVASVEAHPAGGVELNIVFVNKPDKVFTVWVYGEESNWELRTFCDAGLNTEAIETMNRDNKQYIIDPRLSI